MADEVNDQNNDDILRHNLTVISCYSEPWDTFEFRNMQRDNTFSHIIINVSCAIAIFGGGFTNILAFVILVRSRLWLKHEGYFYLAANFCVNVGILLFCTSSFWLMSFYGWGYYPPPNTSNFMCKVWHFFMNIFFASGWLSVALLFNVYLREHLKQRRRCGCPMFAVKYCTLYATKIIVGVICGVLAVFGVPYLVIFDLHDGVACSYSLTWNWGVALIVESMVMWVLPFFFFIPIILVMTLCTKREDINTFGFSQIEERSASDDQMRAIAVTLSSMTLFSQVTLVFIHVPFVRQKIAVLVIELTYGLSIALQPLFCFIILKVLRDGFRSQLPNMRCCRRLFPSLDRDEGVVQLTSIQEDPTNPTEF